jgi:hypothetical protein
MVFMSEETEIDSYHYATSRKVAGSRSDEVNEFFFSFYLIFPAALGPGDHSASNWTVSTATSSQYLAVNCEPIV